MTMHEDDRSREGRVLATELTRRGLVKSAAAATAGAAVFGGAAKFGARSAAAAAPSAAQAAAGEQLFYNYALQNNPLTYDFNSNLYAGAEPEVWAGLLTFDPDGRVVPDWAERWESNEDASVWTFYLRQNNKGWSNGDPVTAHDAVWSLARILNPETNNSYAFILYDVKNGEAFNGGTAKVEDLGLKAIDDWTVEITLEGPRANFPQKIAYTACVFAHRPSVEQHGEKWALGGDIPLVSNGPYKLDLWEQGVKAVHSLNPGYWDAETIRVTKLIDPIIPGDQTALAFESGKGDQQLDWTPVGAADLQRFQGDPNLAPLLKQFVFPGIWMLLPSNGQAPFDKIEVRRALSHAIDRDRLVTVTNGLALPANVMTPVGVYGYFEDPAISEIQKFDPALAMEALKGTEYEG
ncbi:MAG: ABC transporter substrate-binding protein, partial [Chloroflexota bacterium]|nr:ABC transporter substrate-binding protein [Chloroflexota bacterium]